MSRHIAPLLFLALAIHATAGEDDTVNLLRLPSAKAESTTAPGGDTALLAALTDGDPSTAAEAAASEAAPLDIVYAFGGATVAPEGVRVTLPAKSDCPAARVEVLVSTVSAHAGFRSLRADPLAAGAEPQTFSFPASAARWVLVRLVPAPDAKKVAAAEVEVFGREGEPKSHYAFSESPAKAFDVLQRLEKTTSLKIDVTEDEKAMFAKARAGRLDPAAFTEAALLASGVLDSAKRKDYLKRIDALEAEARKAVAKAKTSAEKGDALLQWLHRAPLAKGYVSEQTDLSTILDTQTFNCVSSAALFNVLALRLGLDVRAIEVPDHAFSILYEGTNHMDVETTTPMGFNPARDPAAVDRFEKMTGFRYIPDAHRDQRREIEEAGLVAIIYYNHGVALSREKRYHEALVANFRAMSLDPEFDSAVKNALAVLANWGSELAREGKHEDALEVVSTGLALAPQDAALLNNRSAVWGHWAQAAIDAGKAEEAIEILRRAAEAVPDGGFTQMQAWVYLKHGETCIDEGRWEEALAATEAGLTKLDPGPREEVAQWRVGLYLRWFNAEVREKRFEASAGVLEKGMKAAPGDERFLQNAAYLVQEWAEEVHEKDGAAKGIETLRTVRRRFQGIEGVAEVASNHVRRVAYKLADAGQAEEALAFLEQGKEFVTKEETLRESSVYIYDRWARRHIEEGVFEKAADVYAKALERFPEESLLTNNVAWLGQEWTKAAYEKGGAAAAAEVSKALATKFPGLESVRKSGAGELKRTVHDLARNGKFQEALDAIEKGKGLLEGVEEENEVRVFVYHSWAKSHMGGKAWDKAADVLADALAGLPDSEPLQQDVAYLAQEWAEDVEQAAGGAKADEVLQAMLKRFSGLERLARVGQNHVGRAVNALVDAGRYEEALERIDASKALIGGEEAERELAGFVYDTWAAGHMKSGSWQAAIDVYTKGLARSPDDGHLRNNAVAVWDRWAKTFMEQKDWDGAIGVYAEAMKQFPDESLFQQNTEYCKEQKGR